MSRKEPPHPVVATFLLQFTGPLSSPEYLSHLPKAVDYRKHAPGTPPVKAFIPNAEDDRIYDIKYYVRDTRRAHLPGGTITIQSCHVDPKEPGPIETSDVPPTPGTPYKWKGKYRPLLDNDNNGYTL